MLRGGGGSVRARVPSRLRRGRRYRPPFSHLRAVSRGTYTRGLKGKQRLRGLGRRWRFLPVLTGGLHLVAC